MDDYDIPSPTVCHGDDEEEKTNWDDAADCLLTGLTYLTQHITYHVFCDFFHYQPTNRAQAEYMQMRCNTLEWLTSLCNHDRRRVIQWAYQAPNLPTH